MKQTSQLFVYYTTEMITRAITYRMIAPVRNTIVRMILGPQLMQQMQALQGRRPRRQQERYTFEFPALQGTPELPSLFPQQGQLSMLDYVQLMKFLNKKR